MSGTDTPDRYAVVGHPKRKYLWILSRTPQMKTEVYEEILERTDIDAVEVVTPDHWHAPMSIEALRNDVHVYVEKPMTHTVAETYELREAARNSKAVFQVGHQHRQTHHSQSPG